MQQVLFVNPKDRNERAKPMKAKKRRSAKQRANDRRLGQMARARHAARKSNPAKGSTMKRKTRKAAKRSAPAVRHHTRHSPARRHKSRAHSRRRRSNPISLGSFARPMSLLKPALIGAAGAVLVNTALSKVASNLPASLTTGNAMYLTRAIAAIGLGYAASKMGAGSAVGAKLAEGSLTVTFHDMIVANLGASMGLAGAGMRANRGVGTYVRTADSRSQPFIPGVAKYLPPAAGPFQPNGVLQGMGSTRRAGISRGR